MYKGNTMTVAVRRTASQILRFGSTVTYVLLNILDFGMILAIQSAKGSILIEINAHRFR